LPFGEKARSKSAMLVIEKGKKLSDPDIKKSQEEKLVNEL